MVNAEPEIDLADDPPTEDPPPKSEDASPAGADEKTDKPDEEKPPTDEIFEGKVSNASGGIGSLSGNSNTTNVGGNHYYYQKETGSQNSVRTGRIPKDRIQEEQDTYVRRPIDQTLKQFAATNLCVALVAPSGSGRMTAAKICLAQLVGPENIRIVDNTTDIGLDQEIQTQTGYILDLTLSGKTQTTQQLYAIADQCREEQSYYILIGDTRDWKDADTDFTFVWEAPTYLDLLKGVDLKVDIENSWFEPFTDCPIGEISSLIRQLGEAQQDIESYQRVFEEHSEFQQENLRQWFSEKRTIDEWTLLVALAFLNGAPHHSFFESLEQLRELATDRILVTDPELYAKQLDQRIKHPGLNELERGKATLSYSTLKGEASAPSYKKFDPESLASHQVSLAATSPQRAELYLSELWRNLPGYLHSVVLSWLKVLPLTDYAWILFKQLSARVATLARFDSEACNQVAHVWAAHEDADANRFAAEVVNTLASAPDTAELATFMVRRWGLNNDLNLEYTAVVAFGGEKLSVASPEQAFEVFVAQAKKRPVDIRKFWREHVKNLADDPEHAIDLVERLDSMREDPKKERSLAQRKAQKKAQFDLVNNLFWVNKTRQDADEDIPSIIEIICHDKPREQMTELVAGWLISGNEAAPWLRQLTPWLDCEDKKKETVIGSFMYRTLRSLANHRQDEVMDWIEEELTDWDEHRKAPSTLAKERCLKLFAQIRSNRAEKERNELAS